MDFCCQFVSYIHVGSNDQRPTIQLLSQKPIFDVCTQRCLRDFKPQMRRVPWLFQEAHSTALFLNTHFPQRPSPPMPIPAKTLGRQHCQWQIICLFIELPNWRLCTYDQECCAMTQTNAASRKCLCDEASLPTLSDHVVTSCLLLCFLFETLLQCGIMVIDALLGVFGTVATIAALINAI